MPKKLSIKKASRDFESELTRIENFATTMAAGASSSDQARVYDYAIIATYRSFEALILECLVGSLNRDPAHFRKQSGAQVPKHINRSTCEYLITGGGYFDFKGRDGLVKLMKRFVPDSHFLLVAVKAPGSKTTLERLSGLRNFAAHGSGQSKQVALSVTGMSKMGSAGGWLRVQGRFAAITGGLRKLAKEIEDNASF